MSAGDEPAPIRHLRGQRERLAAGAGAQVDDGHARRAPRRPSADQLAAFVLDLDQPARQARLLLDLRCPRAGAARSANAASARLRAARQRRRRGCLRARLTRRSSGARSSRAGQLRRVDQRIEPLGEPGRRRRRLRRPAPRPADRRRAVRRAVEQGEQRRIVLRPGRASRRGPTAGRSPARRIARIDQLAHRPAVLRAGIAARLEIARDRACRRRRRRSRAAAMISSSSSIAAWTRAAGVMLA